MPDPSPTDIPANLRRRPELWMVLLFLVSLAALGFFLLAGEVVEGDTAAFDEAILLALRTPGDLSDPIGSHWVEEMARDMTALGGVAWLTSLTIGVAGYLALSRHTRTMWFLLIAIGSGTLISRSAKMLFERARPDLVHYERVEGAHHVGAWNVDPARYQAALVAFLESVASRPASTTPATAAAR